MEREIEMIINVPKEFLENFRLFIVLHGGKIVKETEINNKIEKKDGDFQ